MAWLSGLAASQSALESWPASELFQIFFLGAHLSFARFVARRAAWDAPPGNNDAAGEQGYDPLRIRDLLQPFKRVDPGRPGRLA